MAVLALFIISVPSSNLFAAAEHAPRNSNTKDYNFEIRATDNIKNNPLAMKILKNIEISKMRMAEMLKKQAGMAEHKNIIEKQRKAASEDLQQAIRRMDSENFSFTPRESYGRFVSQVNATIQPLFWDQFDVMAQKVNQARQARLQILQEGGSMDQARMEFYKKASIERHHLIKYIRELNIKHGFTNEDVQKYFDKYGKLPRYND